MDARYTDAARTRVSVTLAAGEVAGPGIQGPGSYGLSEEATEDLIASGVQPEPYIPAPLPPRAALGSALRDALKATSQDAAWQTALTGQSQDTRDWWTSGYRDLIAIDSKKLVRIAAACIPKVDLDKLYTAAGA